jgi:predicted ATP-dependent endonuclease of OLD family
MKITQIKITDFHQFKDLTIDLTYPKGHTKEGQPLDKVCFIGQSGTGKTSLLEVIPTFLFGYHTHFTSRSDFNSICNNIKMSFSIGLNNEFSYVNMSIYENRKSNNFTEYVWRTNATEQNEKERSAFYLNWVNSIKTKLIYFPANLNYNIEIGNETALNVKKIIDFSIDKIAFVWNIILDKIQKYQEQELQIRQEISKTVEQASNNLDIIKQALKKLEDWKSTEFNPIQDIADNCLNKLLAPFKLRVKTELDIKSKDDIGFIKVEDFAGIEIPHGLWSTGTKQVILSAMPLYLLKPKHTVILFDEPERSLYPDMQRFIVDYYSSLADNCQFFYATHSPIIASSFEPWEIVELKFNQEGKIYRELYYEGENHVDNYKWNPKHMRWDDILQRVFDMENDGGPERKKLLDELARSNVKYKKLDKQGNAESEEAKELIKRIEYLRKELSYWN